MSRRPLTMTIAAAAVFAGSVAFASSSGAAVDQDLVVSAVAGPPGTRIDVSSASCVDDDDSGTLRLLSVRLVASSATGERLAGAASDFDGAVTVVVPDWVDADEPATVEASCLEVVFSRDDVSETEVVFTPVDFDIEPGVGSPSQQRTASRTALKAGQAFQDSFSGCTLPDATYLASEVYGGSDLTGRTLGDFVAGNQAELADGVVDVALSNGTYSISFTQTNDDPVQLGDVSEYATDIPAGTYSSYGYCGDDAGTILFFEPTTVEVTGDAPFDAFDLTQPDPHTRSVVLEGQGCTVGTVDAATYETSLAEIQADLSGGDSGLQAASKPNAALASGADLTALLSERAGVTETGVTARSNAQLAGPSGASVGGGQRATVASGQLTPDADGVWAARSDLDFDEGLVESFAICGDPLAAGFYYDPQVVVVAVTPAPIVPPTTTPAVQPATNPTPANAVNGSPTYTG